MGEDYRKGWNDAIRMVGLKIDEWIAEGNTASLNDEFRNRIKQLHHPLPKFKRAKVLRTGKWKDE